MIEENEEDGGFRLSEICKEMERRVNGTPNQPYSIRNISRILKTEYSEVITIAKGFALLQESTEEVLRSHVTELKDQMNPDDQAESTIIKAATLLTGQIIEFRLNRHTSSYFSIEDLSPEKMVSLLPRLLKLFLENLYPRSIVDAIKLHAERAYLQIQEWQDNSLDPESFGWKLVEGVLEPVPMRQAPAPPFLLDVKKCGCSTSCEGGRCGCLGNGLPFTNKCTCIDCKNPKNIFNTSEDVSHTVPEDYIEGDESMHELA